MSLTPVMRVLYIEGMPVELLAILAAVLIALAVGLWRTRDERAAARAERER